jgi:DNA-binding protein HU-beta
MTKEDLIGKVADLLDVTAKDARPYVDAVVKTMSDALITRESITLRGLGSFQIAERKPKKVRDIKRGVSFTSPAGKRVKFIPARIIKKELYL